MLRIEAPMICYRHAFRPLLLLAAWLLMMPPVPMGTELPPISKWRQVSSHENEKDCETARKGLRDAARETVTNDPNAHALTAAAALGGLQAKCVEVQSPPKPQPKP